MKKLMLFLVLCFIFNGCDDSGDSGNSSNSGNLEIPKKTTYYASLNAANINFTQDDLEKKFSMCNNDTTMYAKAKTILDKAGLKFDNNAENSDFCVDAYENTYARYYLNLKIYSVPPKDNYGCYYINDNSIIYCCKTVSDAFSNDNGYLNPAANGPSCKRVSEDNVTEDSFFSKVYEIYMDTGISGDRERAQMDFLDIIADRIKNNPDESVFYIQFPIYE